MSKPAFRRAREEPEGSDDLGSIGDHSALPALATQDQPINVKRISASLERFLRRQEHALRQMAADEQDRGVFTPGLSRYIDVFDSGVRP